MEREKCHRVREWSDESIGKKKKEIEKEGEVEEEEDSTVKKYMLRTTKTNIKSKVRIKSQEEVKWE